MPYVSVTPAEHDPACRRGRDPASPEYRLDRERCQRCRNLWQRLIDATARRRRREIQDA